jgi:hypothetical protein
VAQAMFRSIEHELDGGAPIGSQSVDIYAPEGDFAAELQAISLRHPDVEIGSYPFSRDGRFGASIVVRGQNAASVDAAIGEIRTTIGPLE